MENMKAEQRFINDQDPLHEMLNRMRQEGVRYPNYGVADERLNHRKHVESRVIEPKQITGEQNE